MSTFIIEAEYLNGMKSYIRSTSPIVWTDNIDEAQKFPLESDAEYDLNDNFYAIETTFFKIKMVVISILEINNGKVIGRKQII